MDPRRQLERMTGNGEKFARVWNCRYERTDLEDEPENHLSVAHFDTTGPNWRTHTRFVQFGWDDVLAEYEGQPYPAGFFANFPKYLSFYFDGSVWRYLRAHWRYGLLTIYPLVAMIAFAIVSWFVLGYVVSATIGPSWVATAIATIIAVMVLNKWPGDKLHLNLWVSTWGFTRDLANGSNPRIEQRFDDFAGRLTQEIETSKADEIIVCGHSFGTVWAAQALARALRRQPDLLAARKVVFLALGSSLPKTNLVPGAEAMRQATRDVMAHDGLIWDETQTHIDILGFHRTEPHIGLGIEAPQAETHVHHVRYSRAMEKRRYRKMRRSFYRTHRQYVLYQDVRCHFDYFLKCFGPIPTTELARDEEAIARIDENGALHANKLEEMN